MNLAIDNSFDVWEIEYGNSNGGGDWNPMQAESTPAIWHLEGVAKKIIKKKYSSIGLPEFRNKKYRDKLTPRVREKIRELKAVYRGAFATEVSFSAISKSYHAVIELEKLWGKYKKYCINP